MIEFKNVAVCYDLASRYPVNALEGINLNIEAGEWVFLVGPSGAGKSTLLKLIYSGAQATRGQVLVGGQEITHLPQREIPLLRRKIGVVFQDFQLLPQKTVWENVAFALQVIGAPQKRLVRDVPQALETVGLTYKSGARPHELSGGEQQRVAIARAIVNNPRILLADEPTGNLDPHTAWEISQVLQRISERGTTIVTATHDRAVVDAMRKRVVRIADGKVVSDAAEGVYHPEDEDLRARHADRQAVPSSMPTTVSDAEPDASRSLNGASATPPGDGGADAPRRTEPGRSAGRPLVEKLRAPVRIQAATRQENTAGPDPDSLVENASHNQAPIGSPDNPIVQF
jgi:cell division transport system ATP-binding protein